MTPIRRLLASPLAAALVVVAALLLRLLVPGGFMPAAAGGWRLAPCPEVVAAPAAHAMVGHGGRDDASPPATSRCAFADLALPATGDAEAVVPAILPAPGVAVAAFPRAAAPRHDPRRLKPPSHAPPLAA